MNALEQVINTIYKQREIYLMEHIVNPGDLVVRVSVNFRLRDEMRRCSSDYFYVDIKDENQQEKILGGPLLATRDVPDDTYYLDLMVYNRVQKQLKFTLQGDGGTSS